jgi:hypothetical protein
MREGGEGNDNGSGNGVGVVESLRAKKGAQQKDEDFADKQLNKYKLPGLPESVAVKSKRVRNRAHTLNRIDQVHSIHLLSALLGSLLFTCIGIGEPERVYGEHGKRYASPGNERGRNDSAV